MCTYRHVYQSGLAMLFFSLVAQTCLLLILLASKLNAGAGLICVAFRSSQLQCLASPVEGIRLEVM